MGIDIISKESLDKSLQNAKGWCKSNLPKHLKGFKNGVDYSEFQYIIDNNLIGPDMCLDEKIFGLIRVSTEKLKWYQEREKYYDENKITRYAKLEGEVIKFEGGVEVDPESMFVHEISEFTIYTVPEVALTCLFSSDPHKIAYRIENINRKERGLKPWPII